MAHYHLRLSEIKKLGNEDFLEFQYMGDHVSLRPLDESEETIQLLTEWRNKYYDGFLEKFTSTFERTKDWLKTQVIENPDRILFMIYLNGKKIAHVGTFRYSEKTNSAELDNMIRGVRGSHPGLMQKVEKIVLKWMFEDLKLSKIEGRLFSDNYKMLKVHNICGWLTVGNIPLKRIVTKDGWKWKETKLKPGEYPARYFLKIELPKERFFALEKFM